MTKSQKRKLSTRCEPESRRRWGLVKVIRQAFANDRILSVAEIYEEVQRKIVLTPEMKRIKYNQPNFQHSVRKTLYLLSGKGEIARVDRGKYRSARQHK